MRQAVLVGAKSFAVRDAAAPALGPRDVLVAVATCGVCASELEAWQDGEGAPRVLGHEVAGQVLAAGAEAGFRAGERVTGLFGQGFADQALTSADRVTAVPEAIGLDHCFGEPLACAVSAAERTKVALGDRVAVVGLGFMGLLMLQLLRLKGPASILAIDMRDDALQTARRLGADGVAKPADLADDLKATFPASGMKGRGFDVVVEATGTQAGLTLAGELVREHGVLSILGYHQGGPRQVDMHLWNYKALEVLNAHERRVGYRMDCMRRGLALVAAGRLETASLVTHRFPLGEVGDAFAALAAKPPGFIKAIIAVGAG